MTVHEFSPEPQADVVALLEKMLAKAKRGEIRAVAVIAHANRLDTGSAYALGDGDIAHLVCACERVKLRLLEID